MFTDQHPEAKNNINTDDYRDFHSSKIKLQPGGEKGRYTIPVFPDTVLLISSERDLRFRSV